ncbi:response regulator [Paracoccus yeei]|nr:response regulator [Paracoccus yeei]ATQ57919.1 response regulator [Paracoccus yeei]
MTDALLRERHILVVEDDFLLASELCRALEQAGATIVGPVPDLPAALDLIASAPVVQGAILDVNLRGQMVFPAADMLIERNLPFLFATGYDQAVIPPRFCHVLRLEKPIAPAEAVRALTGILL